MSAVVETQAAAGQREAADPAASVWVSANAGAGKTHVLIDRVTRLLLSGADPGHILCVTFTRAAAAEMEARLFKRLGDWATFTDEKLQQNLRGLQGGEFDDAALRQARKLFARALETPGGLKIRTIHAFCESLLRRFPLEAGVARHFEVLDDRSAFELRAQARTQVLARAQTGENPVLGSALEQLVRLIDEGEFIRLADEALRLQRAGDEETLEKTRAALLAWLGVTDLRQRDEIITILVRGLPVEDLRRAVRALQQGSDSDKKRANTLLLYLGGTDAIAGFEDYRQVFLNQNDTPSAERYIITKAAQKSDPGALDILLREQGRVYAAVQILRAQDVALSSMAALRTGAAVRNEYQKLKQARAALDYDDLIDHVLHVLKNSGAAWVHYKLDEGLDHILVDEAQDTSPEQWEIIRHLSGDFFSGQTGRGEARENQGLGPRTLFAVGDEKQSIFSFQGADPASFAAMRHIFSAQAEAAGLRWRDIALLESYRSTPEVLGAIDCVFANPLARDGLSADDAAVRHIARRAGRPGLVEIWPAIGHMPDAPPQPWDAPVDAAPRSSPRAQMAVRVAEHIAGLLRDGPVLPATQKPVVPDDVIVLVRTRNEFFEECIRQLKLRHIPVAGADRMQLLDQLAVMDLMAVGHFVLMPEDDLNLAVILRSPLADVTEEQLFDLAFDRNGMSLWDRLRSRRGACGAFEDAVALLTELRARADSVPPYEFFAHLLGPLGGRARLLSRLGADANDPIDEFLSLAQHYERQHVPGLQGFLYWLAAAQTHIKRDLEQGAGAVRVMTVHGAKGLEAPVIYLPDTCSMPDGRLTPKFIPVRGGNFFVWPVRKDRDDPKTAEMREQMKRAQAREYRRLLYVAMTRAKDWLFIGGYKGAHEPPAECWYNLIKTALEPQAQTCVLPWGEEGLHISGGHAAPPASPAAALPRVAVSLPAWARRPAPDESIPMRPLAPSRLGVDTGQVFSPRRSGAADDPFKRGRLIHLLLQHLPDLDPAVRRAAASRYLSQPGLGLSGPAIEEIAGQALKVLEFPEFAAVFGPGSRAEVPLAGLVPALGNGVAISGQIDRLLISEREILIVDFKTHRPPPISMQAVPDIYLRQMAAYRAALRLIYPDHLVRCALIWTDIPLLMPLAEGILDAAIASS
ncbi:MAG: double-strand break repair helicase AddA [Alphaproteobacteria bacterium]|nr:double-strand break repair helicase AddA [Alphaproteobacteria bacterium]